MKPLSTIDMGEVTRLTRAGRLADAMARLRGDALAPAADEFVDAAWRDRPGAGGAGLLPGLGRRSDGRGAASSPAATGARFEERSLAGGGLTYKVFVPSGLAGQAVPVVVMLHGCTQDPDDFAAGTGMNELAEEQLFIVAYPRQPASANAQKCWNWFATGHQRRGTGEPAALARVAEAVVAEFGADRTRVYVAGLSAGGAAAAVLAETYPDLFAAVGVHSGLACGLAGDVPSAFAAMQGKGRTRPVAKAPAVPTIVFHGDADRTVHPVNADLVVAAPGPASPLRSSQDGGTSAGGVGFRRTLLSDAAGRVMHEKWDLHGVGHAWSGGSPRGTYTDPRGPDASREMVRFFLTHRLAGA